MKSLQKDTERPVAFSAIGEIAVAIREDITKYLDAIVWAVKQVLSKPKGASLCNEALSCISMLSTAVGTSLKPYIEDLLRESLFLLFIFLLLFFSFSAHYSLTLNSSSHVQFWN
jgi:hypothetical protein